VTPCIRVVVVVVAMQRVLKLAWIGVGALNSSRQDLLGGRGHGWQGIQPARQRMLGLPHLRNTNTFAG
jgi:hypothetical protein